MDKMTNQEILTAAAIVRRAGWEKGSETQTYLAELLQSEMSRRGNTSSEDIRTFEVSTGCLWKHPDTTNTEENKSTSIFSLIITAILCILSIVVMLITEKESR